MRMSVSKLLILFCFGVSTAQGTVPYTAYTDPAIPGNQVAGASSIGMDFDVNSAISVSALGAFEGAKILSGSITVEIWNRDTQRVVPGLSLVITGTKGTRIAGTGDRIVPLPSPVSLPADFHGSVVAYGYGMDSNGNGIIPDVGGPARNNYSTMNTGNGLISFKGLSRQGEPGKFPGMPDMHLAQYGGPTFVFDQETQTFLSAVNRFRWELSSVALFILVFMATSQMRRRAGSRR